MGARSVLSKEIKLLYDVLSCSSHVIDNFLYFSPLPLYSMEKEKFILLFMAEPIRIVLDEGYFKPISVFIFIFKINRKSVRSAF